MPIKTNLDKTTIPTIEARLPSGGTPYKKDHPDFPGSIQVVPYSWATERILLSGMSIAKKYIEILKSVGQFPKEFDVGNLISGDYQVILACARAITYGEPYIFKTICPKCEASEEVVIKVPEELPVNYLAADSYDEMVKSLEVSLPFAKDRVGWKFLSLNDEVSIFSSLRTKMEKKAKDRSKRKQQQVDEEADFSMADMEEYQLAYSISAVNGGKPDNIEEAASYLKRLHGNDIVVMVDAIRSSKIGIRFDFDVRCDGCGLEYQTVVPLEDEFFRRSLRKGGSEPITDKKK